MARGAKAEEQLRKQKESKQKKLLLFVLIPALAVALAIQGPKLKDLVSSTKEKTESVQGQVVQGFEELAPTTPVETGAPSSDPTAAAISATAGLSDTDAPPETDEGQLISFTRFDAQDPFVQLVAAEEESTGEVVEEAAPAAGNGSATTPTTDTTATTSSGTTTTTPENTTGSGDVAVPQVSISVNGTVVVVAVGATFPESDPAFKLVAIEGEIVKIGLAGGSFSNNVETIDLRVGDTVTLISQPDGARFQLKLVKIG